MTIILVFKEGIMRIEHDPYDHSLNHTSLHELSQVADTGSVVVGAVLVSVIHVPIRQWRVS